MSATLRRFVPAVFSVLLLLGLSACGADTPAANSPTSSTPTSSSPTASSSVSAGRLDEVSISGDVGTIPKVTWKSPIKATSAQNRTIVAGDGSALGDGDSALVHFWIGNGSTQAKATSSYDAGKAELFTLSKNLNPLLVDALTGATVGSRVAVTSSASEVFGTTGNPTLGIGAKDSVLLVIDVVSAVEAAPSGAAAQAPSWMPAITPATGDPAAFDFTGIPQPAGKFRKATLLAGKGERVRKGMTVAVNYLGQVYGGAMPFDESYTKAPIAFGIGVGQVIPGWDKQVVGSTVGSRIVIEVPPKLGYGAAGNSQAGIKGTDTLYFVIDILGAG